MNPSEFKAGAAADDLLAGFRLRAEPLGVTVGRASPGETTALFLADLAGSWAADEAVVAPAALAALPWLPASLAAAGLGWRSAGTPESTREAPLGIGVAELALAETGSLLMIESTLEDRSVGMLAAGLLIVVPTAGLVPGLDEAAPALRNAARRRQYATLVTGPSRTADIERVLTVGVQGPARVAALFIDRSG